MSDPRNVNEEVKREYEALVERYESTKAARLSRSVGTTWDEFQESDANFEKAEQALSAFLEAHQEFVEPEKKRKIELENQVIRDKYGSLGDEYKAAKDEAKKYYDENPYRYDSATLERLESKATKAEEKKEEYYKDHLQVLDPGEYEKRQTERQAEAAEKRARKDAKKEASKQREAEEKQRREAAKEEERKQKEQKEQKRNEVMTKIGECRNCYKEGAGASQADPDQAILKFSEAIKLAEDAVKLFEDDPLTNQSIKEQERLGIKDEHAKVYIARGNVYQAQEGGLQNAIIDYDKAMEISNNDGIKKPISEILASKTKKEIFEAIKGIPDPVLRKSLAEVCLIKESSLGEKYPLRERMWKKEGALPCRLGEGTLAKIQKYIDSGCPLMTPSDAKASKSGLFSGLRNKMKKVKDSSHEVGGPRRPSKE